MFRRSSDSEDSGDYTYNSFINLVIKNNINQSIFNTNVLQTGSMIESVPIQVLGVESMVESD